MNRFKMLFDNSKILPTYSPDIISSKMVSIRPLSNPVRNVALNANMINRIHKAKPGCSACGKKVM